MFNVAINNDDTVLSDIPDIEDRNAVKQNLYMSLKTESFGTKWFKQKYIRTGSDADLFFYNVEEVRGQGIIKVFIFLTNEHLDI